MDNKLKTVGVMTDSQINDLLNGFPKKAEIHRSETIHTVYAPNGTKVLSAAQVAHNQWHVMAVAGLIQAA